MPLIVSKGKVSNRLHQTTNTNPTNLSSASRESQKSAHSHPSFQKFDLGCLDMFCSFTTLNDSPESPNSNLLDRFSLLGMCWKPFCTHLTLGHFWLNFVWDFQSLSQRKSPKKLKVLFAANGANQIMSGCFQKHPQYGVCNKYIPFF